MLLVALLALLPLTSAVIGRRTANYARYHNSGCLHRSLQIHVVKNNIVVQEDYMSCDKIRVRCSEIMARTYLQQVLRFDSYQANCTAIIPADKECEHMPGCATGLEKTFMNHHLNVMQKLCLGVAPVVERPVVVPVRYAPLPPNLPNFSNYVYFDDLKSRVITVETGDAYHRFDPVVVCQSDDVYARIIPKFVLNQLTNDSHSREDFVTIDTTSEYITVMLNVNPLAKTYYESDIFPLPFVISGWSYNAYCNSSAKNLESVPCTSGRGICAINALNDYKCEVPTVFPPYSYCLDQYYSNDRVCINSLLPVSVQSVPNLKNYIVWSFPH